MMASKPPTVRASLPESANSAAFAGIFGWWTHERERLGHLPARANLRPEDLPPKSLPNIIITEYTQNPDRLRFRLIGSALVNFNQRDFTGKYLDEVYPSKKILSYIYGLYAEINATRRPLWTVNTIKHPRTSQDVVVRRLMTPLAANGVDVDMCVALQTFEMLSTAHASFENPWFHSPDAGEKERQTL